MKKTAAALLMLIMLTACSAHSSGPVPNEAGSLPAAPPSSTEETAAPHTGKTAPEAIRPTPAATGKQAEEAAEIQNGEPPDEAEKTYRMNENYIIVPKHEGGNKKVVLLTFDDGPKKAEWIGAMLDVLEKHEAKAIFFVNGYRVEQNPELLQKIAERGQVIGNHSWDHVNLAKLSEAEIDRQIEDVQHLVERLTGEAPQFFRPPHGASNDYVKQKAARENMLFMTWSNGSEDWLETNRTPEKVIQRVMEQLHPGSNILMHELPWTVEALDALLTEIKNEGYDFVDPRSIEIPAAGQEE
jgi:peptidoglycan/xylan/chitin deacetylase (PgdA/CDA1 family)